MKIEIVHDLLAKSVFDAASAEDKARAKAETLVKARFLYYKSNSTLSLGEGDLNFIRPFFLQLDLTQEEETFVSVSEQRLKIEKNRVRNRNYIIIGLSVAIVCLPFVFLGWYNAYTEARRANYATEEKNITKDSLKNARSEVHNLRKAVVGEEVNIENLIEEDPEYRMHKKGLAYTTLRVWGVVTNVQRRPLPNAEIEFLGAKVKANRMGQFEMFILLPPYYSQQKELEINIHAKGHKDLVQKIEPKEDIKIMPALEGL